MNDYHPRESSIPDRLIAGTTSAALIAFGITFFDDAVIMGHTILTLGLLSAGNELLKLRAARSGADNRRVRLGLALAYVTLVLAGFLFPPPGDAVTNSHSARQSSDSIKTGTGSTGRKSKA